MEFKNLSISDARSTFDRKMKYENIENIASKIRYAFKKVDIIEYPEGVYSIEPTLLIKEDIIKLGELLSPDKPDTKQYEAALNYLFKNLDRKVVSEGQNIVEKPHAYKFEIKITNQTTLRFSLTPIQYDIFGA